MSQLSTVNIKTIVELVQPLCGTEKERRTLMDLVFAGAVSRPDIDTGGAPLEFTRRLIFRLIDYGEIEPGKPALWALLDVIRSQVGINKQKKIDALHPSIFTAVVPSADYVVATDGGKLIFISYSTVDAAFADRLRADLSAAGLNLWIDRVGLKVGTPNWEDAIRDALKRADSVLLIASPTSRKSRYVRDELAIAQDNDKPIYPVWADGDKWSDSIAMGYGTAHHVDLRGDKYAVGLAKLIEALGGTAPLNAASVIEQVPEFLPVTRETLAPPPSDFVPRNPYKGLKAFQADDRADFFGRDAFVNDLLEALRENSRFLAVIGASGSGKSSVVMAGLLPRLHDGALPGSAQWVYLDPFVPGVRPIEALSIALAKYLPQKAQTTIDEDLLHPSARGLYRLAKQISQTRFVLYIDQFEELFTQTADDTERRQFIDLLTTAANEPDSAVTIVLTLRADFYDRPLSYADLGALFEAHAKAILPLTLADLYDVILKPAALDDVRLIFEPGLAEEMVFSVKGEAGALPLLQFTLDQLFQQRDGLRLTRAAYNALGEVRGALAKHAEATYQTLDANGQMLARGLFLRLIEPGATEHDTTRRRASMTELTLTDAVQTERLRAVSDTFVQARLLTTDSAAGEDTLEVSHEALIREWDRLKTWLNEARDDVTLMKRIAADADEWARKGQPEDALYRGRRLREAQEWTLTNAPSATEAAFVAAGAAAEQSQIAAEEKRQRQGRVILISLWATGSLLVLALIMTFFVGRQTLGFINEIATATLAQGVAILEAKQAQTQVSNANATLTSIPGTLAAANAQLTAIPPTLTQVVQLVNAGEARVESLRLASEAANILNTSSVNAEIATLLGIRALRTGYTLQADSVLVRAAENLYTVQAFIGHTEPVASVVFSPDGRFALSSSDDSTLRLWEVETGVEIRVFTGHTDWVNSVAFSPDGRFALSGSGDATLRLWEVETGAEVQVFTGHTDWVESVVFSPDGRFALSGSRDGTLRLWEVETGDVVQVFTGHTDWVYSVAFSSDGRFALSGSRDTTMRLWEVETGDVVQVFTGHTDWVTSVVFSPDGRFALSGSGSFFNISGDNTLRLWDVETGAEIRVFAGHTDGVRSVDFSPDGRFAISGSRYSTLRLWEVETGREIQVFTGHTNTVNSVAFSLDGRFALSGSVDRTLRLWEVETGAEIRVFAEHRDWVTSVVFSPDGRFALSGSVDRTLRLWEVETGAEIRVFTGHRRPVTSVVFSPDARFALSGSYDNILLLWEVETGAEVRTFTGHISDVQSVAFSPDGRFALSGSVDRTLRLWEVETGAEIRVFTGHTMPVTSVAFSLDGHFALSGSGDNTLRLWEIETGEMVRTFIGHTGPVTSVAFSPDGHFALSGSDDATLRLWEVKTGLETQMFARHTGEVTSVAFSSDGRYALSGSGDRTLRLWDVATGEEIRILAGHINRVNSVAFSPDGRFALSGSRDRTVRLWDVDYQDFITYACTRVFRDFTDNERRLYGITDNKPTCPQFAES